MKIGIITIATAKYYAYIDALVPSLLTHFLPGHDRRIFVMTDHTAPRPGHTLLSVPHKPWPYSTLLRFHWMVDHAAAYADCDQLFYVDSDMEVIDTVGDEILSDAITAVQHPGFWPNKRGTFEKNPESLACLPRSYAGTYYQGCFFGGATSSVLEMAAVLRDRTQDDLNRGVIAIWHDESHLNWYLAQHAPAKSLLPSYAYPINWNLPLPRKIVHLDKNHAAMRAAT